MEEYTFEKWLNGIPEPNDKFWFINQNEESPSKKWKKAYLEISKAKKETFDIALTITTQAKQSILIETLEPLPEARRKAFIENEILRSEKFYSEFDLKDIILETHSKKLIGITGETYQKVKESQEKLKNGEILRSKHMLNDFYLACYHYRIVEFLKSDLSLDHSQNYKSEPLGVKYLILEDCFNWKVDLNEGQKAKVLSFILGTRQDTAWKIKNQDGKYVTVSNRERATKLLNEVIIGDDH